MTIDVYGELLKAESYLIIFAGHSDTVHCVDPHPSDVNLFSSCSQVVLYIISIALNCVLVCLAR